METGETMGDFPEELLVAPCLAGNFSPPHQYTKYIQIPRTG